MQHPRHDGGWDSELLHPCGRKGKLLMPKAHDATSRSELISNGGDPVPAEEIKMGDRIRLDGPDGMVAWAEVTEVAIKTRTVWMWLTWGGQRMHIRPHKEDEFAVLAGRGSS